MSNEAGTVVRRYAYEPYGAAITVPGTWTSQTPFRFANGEADGTGLYHFGQRYYDPAVGRWTQLDPIDQTGDPGEENGYGYASGSPVNYVDPQGTDIFDDVWEGAKKAKSYVSKKLAVPVCTWRWVRNRESPDLYPNNPRKGEALDWAWKCVAGPL